MKKQSPFYKTGIPKSPLSRIGRYKSRTERINENAATNEETDTTNN